MELLQAKVFDVDILVMDKTSLVSAMNECLVSQAKNNFWEEL